MLFPGHFYRKHIDQETFWLEHPRLAGALDMSASEENVQDGAAPSGTAGYMNSALQDRWRIYIYICTQDESG